MYHSFFLPDFMEQEHGISHLDAGYIISFYGVASMLGRLIGGIYTNFAENSAIVLIVSCMLLMGISCLAMALSNSYFQFAISILTFGMFQGMYVVVRTVALVDIFGKESLKGNYGIVMFSSGFSTMIGPPIAGFLKVYWGTYYYAFFITAGIYFAAGLLQAVLVLENKKNKYTCKYKMIGSKELREEQEVE